MPFYNQKLTRKERVNGFSLSLERNSSIQNLLDKNIWPDFSTFPLLLVFPLIVQTLGPRQVACLGISSCPVSCAWAALPGGIFPWLAPPSLGLCLNLICSRKHSLTSPVWSQCSLASRSQPSVHFFLALISTYNCFLWLCICLLLSQLFGSFTVEKILTSFYFYLITSCFAKSKCWEFWESTERREEYFGEGRYKVLQG